MDTGLDVGDTHDIGEDTGGSDARTGSIALDEHGEFAIALCGKHDDIVAALEIVEGMPLWHLLQGDAGLAVVHGGYKPPSFAFFLQLLPACLKVSIEVGQVFPELLQTTTEEFVGHKEFFLHVGLLYLIAGFAGEDDELAHHIGAAQVDAGVGLAVTLFLGLAYRLREWHVGGDGIENKVECATEDGFYLDCCFKDVDCLQDGLKDAEEVKKLLNERCKMQFQNGLITINDWRAQICEEKLVSEEYPEVFDKVIFNMTDEEIAFINRVFNIKSEIEDERRNQAPAVQNEGK